MRLKSQLFLFYFMNKIGREGCSNLWKMIIFRAYSCFGLVPQVFGQVKEWLMLELHKMIRCYL